jgi:hypothetical protein
MIELLITVCELAEPAVTVMIGITLAPIAMDKVRVQFDFRRENVRATRPIQDRVRCDPALRPCGCRLLIPVHH